MNIQAEEFLDLGITAELKGRLEEAEKYLKKALQENPSLARAYTGLGNIYLKKNQLDKAEEMYREQIKLSPRSVKAHLNLAALSMLKGNIKKAFSLYEKVLTISPGEWRGYRGIGYICFLRKELDKAIGWLKMAREEKEDELSLYFLLALVYSKKGAEEEMYQAIARVREIAEEMKQFSPQQTTIFYILGKVAALEGRYKECIGYLEEIPKKVKIKNREKWEMGIFYNEQDVLDILRQAYKKQGRKIKPDIFPQEVDKKSDEN